jgi:TolB protein
MESGAPKCWGNNYWGQLGDGTATASSTPVDVSGVGSSVSAIGLAQATTCVVKAVSSGMCWGYGDFGTLGDGVYGSSIAVVDIYGYEGSKDVKASFKIAFSRDLDGNMEIYSMNGDGTSRRRLIDNPYNDIEPAWSPDGAKIAFASERTGNYEVFVMNADGSGQTNITNSPGSWDSHPSWSPDGSRIAFHSNRDGNMEIYAMNPDGSNQSRITNDAAFDGFPAWSPDGAQIAFESDRDGDHDIYTMDVDGSDVAIRTFPFTLSDESHPAWSPDGTKLAFDTNTNGSHFEVCHITLPGHSLNCPDIPGDQFEPAWKTDGSLIAYYSQTATDLGDIHTWTVGTLTSTQLTSGWTIDRSPDWRRVSGPGMDYDKDGCTDAKEAGPNQAVGGRRNPQRFWDFYDTPNASNVRDKAVASTDTNRVIQRFGANDSGPGTFNRTSDPLSAPNAFVSGAHRENYHPAFDRGPASGPNNWNLTAADGAIASADFNRALAQFGHNCA